MPSATSLAVEVDLQENREASMQRSHQHEHYQRSRLVQLFPNNNKKVSFVFSKSARRRKKICQTQKKKSIRSRKKKKKKGEKGQKLGQQENEGESNQHPLHCILWI